MFGDLNIYQCRLKKKDLWFGKLFIIWWGNLKTKVQILNMQKYGVGIDCSYDQYQHIFTGLTLWRLRFDYLKIIREIFYLGKSATERFTLQWAVNLWQCNKKISPNDFYLLENLTIHSYQARIVVILKLWIYQQNKRLLLYNKIASGEWLSKLFS